MKAAVLTHFNQEDEVEIREVAKPAVTAGKVLVEVHEAGVNPFDWKMTRPGMDLPLPLTVGGDFAGVVREVAPDVTAVKPGDEVYGMAGYFNGASGSFAEYDLVDPGSIAPRPMKVSEAEAGALPLTGVMALQAITEYIKLSPGQRLLIQGGAGGIGSLSIQIAKHAGAYVAVTCAGDQIGYVQSLGADEALDYQAQKFEDAVHNYDAVYDLVGGDVYRRSYQVLKPGGVIVSSLMKPDRELMDRYQVQAVYQHFEPTSERLSRLAEMVDQGVIQVNIEKSFPLDQAQEAMAYQEKVHPKGKVVIDVK